MEQIEAYAKKHYLLIGGVVVGFVFLLMILRSNANAGAAASAPLILAGTIWVILMLVFKH